MNKNGFLKNVSWIMVSRAMQLGLTFIMTMLVARYLGPTENGKLVYVYSYVQLFIPICTLGMNDIIVKELVDNKDRNDEILGTMLLTRIAVSIVSMVCSVLLVSALNQEPIYRTIAALQSFSLLFQSFDCLMYFYQSRLLSQRSAMMYALSYISTSVFRLFCVMSGKGIRWFAFAQSLDYILVAVLLLAVYLKDGYSLKISLPVAKDLLKKSRYYIFAGIMIVLYGKVTDILLLGKMVDDTAVGYYGAATTLCNAWPFVLTAIIDSSNPVIIDLYTKEKELFKKRVKQLYAVVFYISILAALMIGLLSNLIIQILYGSEYMAAVTPLRIFAWSTIFSYLGVARTSWMQCEKKTKHETTISLFGAFINVAMNYVLIKRYGIIGASCAAVLTQFLTNYILLYCIKDTRENAKLITEAILLKGVLSK